MANNKEIAMFHKEHLFSLLATKFLIGNIPKEIEQLIAIQITKMDIEDVAYVREQVELLYGNKN
ncbi:MAG: hypothetical protein FWF50_01905 [Defluviitaleaceae bacterium]|nr:hypothetical protein [Defluviitaleaceae bacterium]